MRDVAYGPQSEIGKWICTVLMISISIWFSMYKKINNSGMCIQGDVTSERQTIEYYGEIIDNNS